MRDTAIFILGMLTGATIVYMASFIPIEAGYSKEHRAELDNKIAGLVPLSVADLGE